MNAVPVLLGDRLDGQKGTDPGIHEQHVDVARSLRRSCVNSVSIWAKSAISERYDTRIVADLRGQRPVRCRRRAL